MHVVVARDHDVVEVDVHRHPICHRATLEDFRIPASVSRVSAAVLSVNAGALEPVPGLRRANGSGIHKRPLDRIEVRDPGPKRGGLGSGVVGDAIGSRKHHGGETQAVYAFAREELDWWGGELDRELAHGMFGENLTTVGLDVDAAEIGEQWRVGTALLEVCGPRVPCATFAAHMGERALGQALHRARPHRRLPRGAGGRRDRAGRPDRGRAPTRPRPHRADVLPGRDGRPRARALLLEAEVLPPIEHEWLAGRS